VQFWFWLTPIVYVMTILPESWIWLFKLNPLFHTTAALRQVMIVGTTPDWQALVAITLLGLGLLVASLFVGKKLERDIRDFL